MTFTFAPGMKEIRLSGSVGPPELQPDIPDRRAPGQIMEIDLAFVLTESGKTVLLFLCVL